MTTALIFAVTALAITVTICLAFVHAWRGWIDLKRLTLERNRGGGADFEREIGLRIELAAVKERLKKLEAIASGVEL